MSRGYKECCNWRQCRCGLTLDQPCDCGADGQTMHARVTVWSVGSVPQWNLRWFVPVWVDTTVNIDKFLRQPPRVFKLSQMPRLSGAQSKEDRVCMLLCVPSVSVIRPESSCFIQDRVTSVRLLPYHWPLTPLIIALGTLCLSCVVPRPHGTLLGDLSLRGQRLGRQVMTTQSKSAYDSLEFF